MLLQELAEEHIVGLAKKHHQILAVQLKGHSSTNQQGWMQKAVEQIK